MTSATKSELPRREDSVEDIWRSFAEIRIYKTVINSDRSYLSTVWPDFRPFCILSFALLHTWIWEFELTREYGLSAFSWVCCFLHVVQVQPNMPQGTIFCCGVAQHDWTEPQVTQKKIFMNQPLQSLLNFSLRYLFYQTTFATGTIIKNTSVPAGVLPEGIKEFKKDVWIQSQACF